MNGGSNSKVPYPCLRLTLNAPLQTSQASQTASQKSGKLSTVNSRSFRVILESRCLQAMQELNGTTTDDSAYYCSRLVSIVRSSCHPPNIPPT
jgi:hypothetical protein